MRKMTVLPWLIWAAIIVGVVWATKAHAMAIHRAEMNGVVVTLTDEPCKFPHVVDLPKRATWQEKGKTFEGCWGAHPVFPIVLGYFDDRSVVALPVELFTRVTGA